MVRPRPQAFEKVKVVAENRRARYDYFIEDRFEAGIALTGTEVKSLRQGEGSIAESYAALHGEEVWLINSHIPEYSHGNRLNHEPRRPRKLLLHTREIGKLTREAKESGQTLVPLRLYDHKGKIKLEIAVAKGKKQYDKRQAIAERESKREIDRAMKEAFAR